MLDARPRASREGSPLASPTLRDRSRFDAPRPANGLHGLQVLPLLGWLLARRRAPWLDQAHRSALVVVAGVTYIAAVALLTWQALRGQPLLAPDALTLAALLALVAGAGGAVAGVLAHARAGRVG